MPWAGLGSPSFLHSLRMEPGGRGWPGPRAAVLQAARLVWAGSTHGNVKNTLKLFPKTRAAAISMVRLVLWRGAPLPLPLGAHGTAVTVGLPFPFCHQPDGLYVPAPARVPGPLTPSLFSPPAPSSPRFMVNWGMLSGSDAERLAVRAPAQGHRPRLLQTQLLPRLASLSGSSRPGWLPTGPGVARLSLGDPSVLLGSTFSIFFSGHFYPPFVPRYKASLLPALLVVLHTGWSVNSHLCRRCWTGWGRRWGYWTSGKAPSGPSWQGYLRVPSSAEGFGVCRIRGAGTSPPFTPPVLTDQQNQHPQRVAQHWPLVFSVTTVPPGSCQGSGLTPILGVFTTTLVSTGLSAPRCFLGTTWWWLFFWGPDGEDSLPRAPRSRISRSILHFCMQD